MSQSVSKSVEPLSKLCPLAGFSGSPLRVRRSVLDEDVTVSLCRGSSSSPKLLHDTLTSWNPFSERLPAAVPFFVCCSVNAVRADEGCMYRSPWTNQVQSVFPVGCKLSAEEAREDELRAEAAHIVSAVPSSSMTTSTTNAAAAVRWANRSDAMRRLEVTLNALLSMQLRSVTAPATSAASAYVVAEDAAAPEGLSDSHCASLTVHVVTCDGDAPEAADKLASRGRRQSTSLFDWALDDADAVSGACHSPTLHSGRFVGHHVFQLYLRADVDQMKVMHAYEARLVRSCTHGHQRSSHGWHLRDHRRYDGISFQDKRRLKDEILGVDASDAVCTIGVAGVAQYLLTAAQLVESQAVQQHADAVVPHLVKSCGPWESELVETQKNSQAAPNVNNSKLSEMRAELAHLVGSRKRRAPSEQTLVE